MQFFQIKSAVLRRCQFFHHQRKKSKKKKKRKGIDYSY